MIWVADQRFHGWICSVCEWSDPLPTLLNDPEAKTAYDRLAKAKFQKHACESHLARMKSADDENYSGLIRKLVAQGFKPKDAVEIFLQEVTLEHRNEPKILERARSAGEDFLRRVREGLV
jgi:uncharacterized protein YoaH (UPF0181 family)